MAYCDLTDVLQMISEEELAHLTAETGDLPDEAVVAEGIARADAEIDAYCGIRYQVPFSLVPPRVKELSVDLAIYHLYSRRSVAPAVRREKYEAAVAFLKQVAGGQAVIIDARGEAPGAAREVADFDSATRVLSRDTLGEW